MTKAKEYAQEILNVTDEFHRDMLDKVLKDVLKRLLNDCMDIIKIRKVSTPEGGRAAAREVEQKWFAIVRIVNAKQNSVELAREGFRLFVTSNYPKIGELLFPIEN